MQILTFFLQQEKFAIDITLVDTIENKMPITPVPKSKDYVSGLISNRGNVITVINTSLILSDSCNNNLFEKLIIVNMRNQKFALAVSEIDDVLDIVEENIIKVNNRDDMSVININSDIITLITYEQLKKI